ncbi:hypothetical protein ACK8P5_26450 (plasmid) [Paenibacillus sp. EC2-1]|uniref:hypothetical protein n=1 Tax=Paenibacillus sp. EC2-1 TaxID=3388665 RepID=UPI003BEED670
MTDVWDCEYYNRCENNDKCLRCGPDQRLLKTAEEKARKKFASKTKFNESTSVTDNSGETLEEYVRDKLNGLPTVKEYFASRQLGSGNIWFMPGDVADPVILAECKERLLVNAKGEKTMTIPKDMIEKIMEEAKMLNRYPTLIFRYKGDENGKTYVVNDFDVLVEMIHEIKILRHEMKVVTNERDMYKAAAEELHKEKMRLEKRLSRLT